MLEGLLRRHKTLGSIPSIVVKDYILLCMLERLDNILKNNWTGVCQYPKCNLYRCKLAKIELQKPYLASRAYSSCSQCFICVPCNPPEITLWRAGSHPRWCWTGPSRGSELGHCWLCTNSDNHKHFKLWKSCKDSN